MPCFSHLTFHEHFFFFPVGKYSWLLSHISYIHTCSSFPFARLACLQQFLGKCSWEVKEIGFWERGHTRAPHLCLSLDTDFIQCWWELFWKALYSTCRWVTASGLGSHLIVSSVSCDQGCQTERSTNIHIQGKNLHIIKENSLHWVLSYWKWIFVALLIQFSNNCEVKNSYYLYHICLVLTVD